MTESSFRQQAMLGQKGGQSKRLELWTIQGKYTKTDIIINEKSSRTKEQQSQEKEKKTLPVCLKLSKRFVQGEANTWSFE